MICDDHDVTDDWYLDGAWCQRVLASPLGRRVVRNALLAYALFQAWGNTPDQFAEPNGLALLDALDTWRGESRTRRRDQSQRSSACRILLKGAANSAFRSGTQVELYSYWPALPGDCDGYSYTAPLSLSQRFSGIVGSRCHQATNRRCSSIRTRMLPSLFRPPCTRSGVYRGYPILGPMAHQR